MNEQNWEIDPHNGNRILRDQLRVNSTTGERQIVDVYRPLHGAKWEVPKRVLAEGEPYPLDKNWQAPIDPARQERNALLADLAAWAKNGDAEPR